MTEPDFKQWGLELTAHHTCYSAKNIADALKQAFEQGYYLGLREGYGEGLNIGWAIEQDKDHAKKD